MIWPGNDPEVQQSDSERQEETGRIHLNILFIYLFILLRQNPHNVKLIMLRGTTWWHLMPSQYRATNIVV